MKLSFTLFLFSLFTCSFAQQNKTPLDDIVDNKIFREKPILSFAPVQERDIFWKKRIWRVIDTREKMNKVFQYPVAPFFNILVDAVLTEKLTAYHPEDDTFTTPLRVNELRTTLFQCDTFEIVDPRTYEVTHQVLCDEINSEDIVRYRIKEMRYFDSQNSRMNTRILGIAPLREVFDELGHFKYEMPLFWVYYPHAREILAQHPTFNEQNDKHNMTWEDLFEMRRFSSYIYKVSNIRDERLQDYLTGVERLQEARKLELSLFNFEQDLWSH